MPEQFKQFAKKHKLNPPNNQQNNKKWITQLEAQWSRWVNSRNVAHIAAEVLPSDIQKTIINMLLWDNQLCYSLAPIKLCETMFSPKPELNLNLSIKKSLIYDQQTNKLCFINNSPEDPISCRIITPIDLNKATTQPTFKIPHLVFSASLSDNPLAVNIDLKHIIIFDINTGKELRTLKAPPRESIFSVAFLTKDSLLCLLRLTHMNGGYGCICNLDSSTYNNISIPQSFNNEKIIDQIYTYKNGFVLVTSKIDLLHFNLEGQFRNSFNHKITKTRLNGRHEVSISDHTLIIVDESSIILWDLENNSYVRILNPDCSTNYHMGTKIGDKLFFMGKTRKQTLKGFQYIENIRIIDIASDKLLDIDPKATDDYKLITFMGPYLVFTTQNNGYLPKPNALVISDYPSFLASNSFMQCKLLINEATLLHLLNKLKKMKLNSTEEQVLSTLLTKVKNKWGTEQWHITKKLFNHYLE